MVVDVEETYHDIEEDVDDDVARSVSNHRNKPLTSIAIPSKKEMSKRVLVKNLLLGANVSTRLHKM